MGYRAGIAYICPGVNELIMYVASSYVSLRELCADYMLLLFERALKMLNNNIYINKICKAVLEISKLYISNF